MVTNVVSAVCGSNIHSTVVGPFSPGHSMTIRLSRSSARTVTGIEKPYISHSHRTCLPASSGPLLFVNQNLVVTSGFTMASNTSLTGRRMSIAVEAIGMRVNLRSCVMRDSFGSLRYSHGRCAEHGSDRRHHDDHAVGRGR